MESTKTPVVGSLGKLRTAAWRVYQDFLMPNRLIEYRAMLASATRQGYQIISVEDWAKRLSSPRIPDAGKLLVLRHDVDTDPRQMLLSAEIEKEFNAGASYFFRLPTMDAQIVHSVAELGFHVSYHFEEVATFAKKHRLASRAEVEARMPEIQELFATNINALRKQFGLPMSLVCSHGDWINRRLGVMNHALLESRQFRQQIGVEFETYDKELVSPMRAYVSDYPAPFWWKPTSPESHFGRGDSPLGVLTHPRQWRASMHNAADIVQRAIEGVDYRWRR